VASEKIKYEIVAINKSAAAFRAVKMGLSGIASAGKLGLASIKALAVATIAAAGALALITKKSFDYIDTLGKTASRTGIATATLQAFQLAAIESGTTVEQTQKGLEKFARSIGDAGRGLKTQADIFRDLGVPLKENNGKLRSFEDILDGVADGLGELGSEAERATVLANLFGRAGIQFSEIFRNGSAGLDDFKDRAKSLGLILENSTIKGVEKFNDTMSVVKLQLGAITNNITASFVPALQAIVEKLGVVITGTKGTADGFDIMGKTIAVTILETLKKAALGVQAFMMSIKLEFLSLASTNMGQRIFGNILDESEIAALEIYKLEKRIISLKESGMKKKGFGTLQILPPNSKEVLDQIDKLTLNLTNLKEVAGTPVEGINNLADGFDRMIELVKAGSPEVAAFLETFNSGITNALEPVAAFEATLGKEGLAKTLGTTAVGAMKKFEDSIMTSLKNGKLGFKDFANYVIEQLMRIAIQQMILKPLTGAFGSFFDGFGDLISHEGGGYTGKGNRSGGMDGKGGGLAILHPNETVIDHTKGQGMGGGSPTVNFNISTVDAAGFDQLLASRKGLITSIINNAMNTQGKMGVT
tara:strand:- start:92 stop:1855 length:1764 start_codon:yes stop_codon:yes gene_type:complete